MFDHQQVFVTSFDVFPVITPRSKAVNVKGRPFHAISYRKSGVITIQANGTTYHSKAGQVTLMPAGTDYRTEVLQDTELIAIHFRTADSAGFSQPAVLDDPTGIFHSLFSRLAAIYEPTGMQHYECLSAFYTLLAQAQLAMANRMADAPSQRLLQARRLLDQHFADGQYSITHLAQTLQVSDSFLRRAFKKQYGLSPVDYLKQLRIKQAKLLLQTDYYSIGQVAQLCGFNSISYFIQSFHKEVGVSPAKYKEIR